VCLCRLRLLPTVQSRIISGIAGTITQKISLIVYEVIKAVEYTWSSVFVIWLKATFKKTKTFPAAVISSCNTDELAYLFVADKIQRPSALLRPVQVVWCPLWTTVILMLSYVRCSWWACIWTRTGDMGGPCVKSCWSRKARRCWTHRKIRPTM